MYRRTITTAILSLIFFGCSVDVAPPDVRVDIAPDSPETEAKTPEQTRPEPTSPEKQEEEHPPISRPVDRTQPDATPPSVALGCRSFATEFVGTKDTSYGCQGNCEVSSLQNNRNVEGRCVFENLQFKCSVSEIFSNGIRLTRQGTDIYPSVAAFVSAVGRVIAPVVRSVVNERFDTDPLHSEKITSRVLDEAGRVESGSATTFVAASSIEQREDWLFLDHDPQGNPVAGEKRYFIDDPQDSTTAGFVENICRKEVFSAGFDGAVYEEVYRRDRNAESGCFTGSLLERSLELDEHSVVTGDYSVRRSQLRFSDEFDKDEVFESSLDYRILQYGQICVESN